MKKSILLALACLFVITSYGQRRSSIPLEHGAHRVGVRTDAEMQRWREHGLGQFIHWGVYAIPGGQWNGKTTTYAAEWFRTSGLITKEEYDNLYKQFNPKKYNAKAWAKQAKQMGAKYLIFTTKHHDGFCLWPSKYSDYTIAKSPYKKDIVKEIVDAYTAEGIDVHLYFSIIDWSHPGYVSGGNINSPDVRQLYKEGKNHNPFKSDEEAQRYEDFKDFTRNQLLELLENYPKIKGLWFDGSWDVAWVKNAAWVDSLGMELREKHKDLIIGSRFRSDEYGYRHFDANGDLIDDYSQVYERNLPKSYAEVKGIDWDCVMTIPENQWGYHRDWSLSYVKNKFDLIEMIVQANAFGGNLVINFGPDGEGNIREEETVLAKEIGDWMTVNGEAVYGVTPSILEEHKWGISTQNGDNLYLTVFNKPMNNLIRVKVPRGRTISQGEKKQSFINTLGKTTFLKTREEAVIKYGGRDKEGYYYYDIVIPQNLQNIEEPFVIKTMIQEIDSSDKEAYMQAIT